MLSCCLTDCVPESQLCLALQAIVWDKKFRKYAEEYYKDGKDTLRLAP